MHISYAPGFGTFDISLIANTSQLAIMENVVWHYWVAKVDLSSLSILLTAKVFVLIKNSCFVAVLWQRGLNVPMTILGWPTYAWVSVTWPFVRAWLSCRQTHIKAGRQADFSGPQWNFAIAAAASPPWVGRDWPQRISLSWWVIMPYLVPYLSVELLGVYVYSKLTRQFHWAPHP